MLKYSNSLVGPTLVTLALYIIYLSISRWLSRVDNLIKLFIVFTFGILNYTFGFEVGTD